MAARALRGRATVTTVLTDRFSAQLLVGPAPADPVEVVGRLLAVQAQDPRGARLALRARTAAGTTAADVDRALSVDRSLVVSWLNRGTLHLVRAEDHPWLHALTAPRLRTGNARQLAQEGVSADDADRAVGVIERALADDGPLTRSQLSERLDAAGVPVAGQAIVYLLVRATIDGVILRGPVVGTEQAFARVHDWLGPPPPVDHEVAVAELCRRYLAGHAPADERDLATWSGLALGTIRAGLRAVAPEVDDDGRLVLAGRSPGRRAVAPPPRLLGSFEPLLHGWRDRSWIVGDRPGVVTSNGIFRPIALVEGRAVATWTLPAGVVELRPFGPLSPRARTALEAEALEVMRYLGRPVPPAPLRLVGDAEG